MPKVHHVKKARKNYPKYGIERGDSYFWWKFRNVPRTMSKKKPTRLQLTRSEFLGWLYGLEDNRFPALPSDEGLESEVQDIVSEITDWRDDLESRLENMPEHLQETANSAMLLQERIEVLDEWVNNLDAVEFDFDSWKEKHEEEIQAGDSHEIEYWAEKLEEVRAITSEI